jgi:hypothetical protein
MDLNNKHTNINESNKGEEIPPFDFYIEDGKYVFTEYYHLKRGSCCGNGCKNCVYEPKYLKGNTNVKMDLDV